MGYKVKVKELKAMIKEAVQEQIAGGINVGGAGRTGGYMAGTQHKGPGMTAPAAGQKPLDIKKFNLEELAAMLKDNPNMGEDSKKAIKTRIMELLKAAGW